MKRIATLIIFELVLLFLPRTVWAADLAVSCNDNGCSPEQSGSLFPSDDWYPGRSVNKIVTVSNSGSNSLSVSALARNPVTLGTLDGVMKLTISRESDNLILWDGNFHDFSQANSVALANLNPGKSENFTYSVKMPSDAANSYQSGSATYDLVLSFSGGAPDVSQETQDSSGGSGGNSSGGGSSQSSVTISGGTTGGSIFDNLLPGVLGASSPSVKSTINNNKNSPDGKITQSGWDSKWWWLLGLFILLVILKLSKMTLARVRWRFRARYKNTV